MPWVPSKRPLQVAVLAREHGLAACPATASLAVCVLVWVSTPLRHVPIRREEALPATLSPRCVEASPVPYAVALIAGISAQCGPSPIAATEWPKATEGAALAVPKRIWVGSARTIVRKPDAMHKFYCQPRVVYADLREFASKIAAETLVASKFRNFALVQWLCVVYSAKLATFELQQRQTILSRFTAR